MAGERSSSIGIRARTASRAELDALGGVVAATVTLAERVRSEAAATLLRRALALLHERGAIDGPEGGSGAAGPGFSPS